MRPEALQAARNSYLMKQYMDLKTKIRLSELFNDLIQFKDNMRNAEATSACIPLELFVPSRVLTLL